MATHLVVAGLRKLLGMWMHRGPTEEVIHFHRTVTLTSAAAATPVALVADSEVPVGFVPLVQGFVARVNGTTAWGTTANVFIQDTAGTPVSFVTIPVATLISQARIGPATSGVTLNDAYANGTGGTAGAGLQVAGNANGTGSDLIVTVWGLFRRP